MEKLQFRNLNLEIKREKIASYKWRFIGEVYKRVNFERVSSDLICFSYVAETNTVSLFA